MLSKLFQSFAYLVNFISSHFRTCKKCVLTSCKRDTRDGPVTILFPILVTKWVENFPLDLGWDRTYSNRWKLHKSKNLESTIQNSSMEFHYSQIRYQYSIKPKSFFFPLLSTSLFSFLSILPLHHGNPFKLRQSAMKELGWPTENSPGDVNSNLQRRLIFAVHQRCANHPFDWPSLSSPSPSPLYSSVWCGCGLWDGDSMDALLLLSDMCSYSSRRSTNSDMVFLGICGKVVVFGFFRCRRYSGTPNCCVIVFGHWQ